MKRKLLLVMLFILCAGVSLFACASSGDLEGRWEIAIQEEELGEIRMVYHFTREGEINLEQQNGDEIPFSIPFGTYVTEGDRLTIYSDGEESSYTFSVKEDMLTLQQEGEEALVFQRV